MTNKKPKIDPLEFACIIADKIEEAGDTEGVEEAIVKGCMLLADRIVDHLKNKEFDSFLEETVKSAVSDFVWETFGQCKIEVNIVAKEKSNE